MNFLKQTTIIICILFNFTKNFAQTNTKEIKNLILKGETVLEKEILKFK